MKKYKKLFYFIDLILPYQVVLTYIFLLIESFSYRGFLRQFIGVNSLFFYYLGLAVIVATAILFITKKAGKLSSFTFIFLKLQSLVLLPLGITYYILFFIEETNYPNYVFSQFHLQIEHFKYVLLFNMYLSALYLFLTTLHKVTYKMFPSSLINKNYFSLLLKVVIIIFFINNLTNTLEVMVDNTAKITKQPLMTYDEKMKTTWGFFYDYMKFVKTNTPPTAIIVIPPAQSHWLTEGNSVLVRYFLFPRKIINLKETDSSETLYQLPSEPFDYILIAKGLWADDSIGYGWPKVPIQASEILYFDENLNVSKSNSRLFDPSTEINQNSWGLIKL